MHRHFAAPWLVTALVCALALRPQVQWYHWQDGAVVERHDLGAPSRARRPMEGGLSS